MSDIKMTEIERFNKALISATDRLELEGHSDCSNELFVASNAIITTIESQNEEIAELKMQSESNMNHFLGANDEADVLFEQIESLKAITELAVKGLREIVKGDESYHTTIFEARDWIDKIEVIADTTLSEIERLSQ